MNIGIISCGWFGRSLAHDLIDQHSVRGSTKTLSKVSDLREEGIDAIHLETPLIPSREWLDMDVIILNIPPFEGQLEWFKTWPWNPKTYLIFISSTSVYEKNAGEVSETAQTQGALATQEEWVSHTFSSSTILRFGGLVGPNRHPGNFLSGKKDLPHPSFPVNLLHLKDAIGFTKLILGTRPKKEIFNVVCDEHSSRKEFYQEYCIRNNLPLPEFKDDKENGKIILNEKAKKLYQFKIIKMIGKSL